MHCEESIFHEQPLVVVAVFMSDEAVLTRQSSALGPLVTARRGLLTHRVGDQRQSGSRRSWVCLIPEFSWSPDPM